MTDRMAAMGDPVAFRAALLIDTDAGPRPLADCLDGWQRADFAAADDGWRQVAGVPIVGTAVSRAYLERPRGHSKTADLAVAAVWALIAARRHISGVAASGDKDQARLLRDAIAKLVALNPWLADLLDVQAYRIVNRHTGSTLDILSADAPSSYGLTPDFVIVDELTHWGSDALWVSLFSAAAKRQHCMLVIISNAGTGQGQSWQWKIREAARTDQDWYFHSLPGCVASWISPKHLAEQRRLLPAIAYARLWENRWTTGSGDALTSDDIDAAITRRGPMRRARPGFAYTAGLDIGLAKDCSALVILAKKVGEHRLVERPRQRQPESIAMRAARELGMIGDYEDRADTVEVLERIRGTGRLRVADVRVWRPTNGRRVDLAAIERAIIDAHERYGLTTLAYDPHQAEYLADRLAAADVPVERVPFTGPNLATMASTILDAFTGHNIDLYPHEQLTADLRNLRIEERSYGVRLTSPRGPSGHGDAATALALAVLASRQCTAPIGDDFVEGQLVY